MPRHEDPMPCPRFQPPRPTDEHIPATTAAAAATTHTGLRPVVVQKQLKFQATVEEYDSDSSSAGSAVPDRCSSPSAPAPSTSAGAETGADAGTGRRGMAACNDNLPITPPSSRDCSPRRRHRPSVHFSTRHPVVLHHRTDSSSSSASSSSSSSSSSPSSSSSCASSSKSSSKEDRVRRAEPLGQETPFLSVVDKQWGVLFTEKGEPTRRLGEVLRGVANYIIREYEPSASLVIPPSKLAAFYRRYRVEKEPFPLEALFDFDSRHALRNLELLYQDLSCEYHLIPDTHHHHHHHHHRSKPSIPALTPTGLQTWLTLLIQASPSSESLRLSRLLLDAPLEADPSPCSPSSTCPSSSSSSSAAPERLPAQLSRHLLPAHRNNKIYSAIASALDAWYDRTRNPPQRTNPNPNPASVSSPPSWSNILYDALGGGVSSSSSSNIAPQHRKPKPLPGPPTPHPHKNHHQDIRPRRHETIVLSPRHFAAANTSRPPLRQHSKFAILDDATQETTSPLRTRQSRDAGTRSRGDVRAHSRGVLSSSSRRVPHPDEQTHHLSGKTQARHAPRQPLRTESYRFSQGREPGLSRDELSGVRRRCV
ncbi:hypothetical protein E4U55_007450 [Claviceps digitariae]|nr:hypothetical protein E4U55_007450 [Claviceps digitariae]